MMELQNKGNYEESKWQELETKIKLGLFCLMNELLQSCSMSVFIYKIFLIVESIQIVYYAINPSFTFLWNSSATSTFQKSIEYFQFNAIINQGSSSIVIPLMYLTFGIQLIMTTILIFLVFRLKKKQSKQTTMSIYCIKLLSAYGITMNTIGIIPFLDSSIHVVICKDNGSMTCYSGIFFLHLTIAIISAVLTIFQALLYNQLFIDLNPCSHLPFASPQNKITFIKLVIKCILPIYTSMDNNGSVGVLFVGGLMGLMLVLLIQRYMCSPMYNRSVDRLIGILEVSIFWITLGSLVSALLSDASVGLFYMFLTLPFISLVYQMLLYKRNTSFMTKQVKSFKKDQEIEQYINILLHLIDTRDNAYQSIQLEGVLKYHMRSCQRPADACYCKNFNQMRDDDDDESNLNVQTLAFGEINQKSQNWYYFLRSIIADAIEKYPKSPRLHLLHAYILQGKLSNKFKSLFSLMFASECKPNLQEEFSIYRYKHIIEEEMVEYDARKQESKGIEVNSIVNFQNKFVVFLNFIEKAVILHLEFWSKLLEETPDIQKILSLGSKITNTVEAVAELYYQLQDINQNHIKCLEIYGNFLKEIVHDDQEGIKVIEKAEYVSKSTNANKQFVDSDKIKYGENSNTCIVTVSGNLNSVGIITNTNNETMRLLGYKKNEIVDQNVNRIIPKVIGDQHDKFMKRFFDTSQSNLIGHERTVFCLHKKGYLIPSTIMIKVLPNLDQGIQIVGFLKEIECHTSKGPFEQEEDIHFLVYREDNYQIQGITETCFTNFGIPASLMYGNTSNAPEFTVDSILPGVVDPKNIEELKSIHGMLLPIDTTFVQQNFLIEDEDDSMLDQDVQDGIYLQSHLNQHQNNNNNNNHDHDNDEHNQQQQQYQTPNGDNIDNVNGSGFRKKKTKYRQANVRVYQIDELDLGDNIKIKVLKFIEAESKQGDHLDNNQQNSMIQDIPPAYKKTIDASKRTQQNNHEYRNYDDENQDGQADEEGSNISGSSVAEDMRHLKDFKQMISEKTEPKSILVLKRTVALLLIILMVLAIVTLVMKVQQKVDVQEGIDAINNSAIQVNLISQVNYYSRLLWLVGNNLLNQDQPQYKEAALKSSLENYVQQLQDTVFKVVRNVIKMKNRQSSPDDDEQLDFTVLQQTGKINIEQKSFSTAIFQFITGASSLKNATLPSFIPKPLTSGQYVESTQIYYYFVRENGLQVFRESGFKFMETFYNFYIDLVQSYEKIFLTITIVAIIILIITQIILIPIVFSVIKTNNKVLSLFGYIPVQEIKELTARCELFIKEFIAIEANDPLHNDNEHDDKHNNNNNNNYNNNNNSYQQNDRNIYEESDQLATVENDKQYNNNNKNNQQQQSKFAKGVYELNGEDNNLDNSQMEMQNNNNNNDKQNRNNNNVSKVDQNSSVVNQLVINSKTPRVGGKDNNNNNLNAKKQEQAEKEAQELEEYENMRSAKLLNQTDNNKKYVIIQFSILAILFIIFFIVRFTIEQSYLNQLDHLFNHSKIISLRPTYTQYTLIFSIEQIVMRQVINSKTVTDLRQNYTDRIYEIQKEISTSGQESFPSAFSSYMNSYNATEYGDICSSSSYAMQNVEQCKSIQNGILQKGLQTAIVSFVEGLRDMIVEYTSRLSQLIEENKKIELQKEYINGDKWRTFGQSMEQMKPTMLETNEYMMSDFSSMLDDQQQIEIIILSVFITLIILIFMLVWIPYLKSLSNKIWRTKGMLNMIPIDVITKHDSLKNAFISGDILRAVK